MAMGRGGSKKERGGEPHKRKSKEKEGRVWGEVVIGGFFWGERKEILGAVHGA